LFVLHEIPPKQKIIGISIQLHRFFHTEVKKSASALVSTGKQDDSQGGVLQPPQGNRLFLAGLSASRLKPPHPAASLALVPPVRRSWDKEKAFFE